MARRNYKYKDFVERGIGTYFFDLDSLLDEGLNRESHT